MKIAVIGTGYVGLVQGVIMSEFGSEVICVDKSDEKIEKLKKGELPIYEPGLLELLHKNQKAKRISFTTDTEEAVKNSEVIFIAVGTPASEDGSADLSALLNVATEIGTYIDSYKVIVNKSTVPVGTGRKVISVIEEQIKNRKENIEFEKPEVLPLVKNFIDTNGYERLQQAVLTTGKKNREEAVDSLEEELMERFTQENYPDVPEEELPEDIILEFKNYYHDLMKKLVREAILYHKHRVDGRTTTEIRPLDAQINVLPIPHGSALFTRGETQSLAITTLGTKEDEQLIDDLEKEYYKKFYLHYNFPPYSVGEVGRMGSPGRRELGHGSLAERALSYVIPSEEEFPYTIRVVSEITESNGSSSQASICGGSLSLMSAGVPIKEHVAGIAMGLIKEEEEFTVLTDIMGLEDHLGDMDFKVAGTKSGITALQMDIKITGITEEIMRIALNQAHEARQQILELMNNTISKPAELKSNVPRIQQITIPKDKIAVLIGPGGKNIKSIIDQTGATVDITDDGLVSVFAQDAEVLEKTLKLIDSFVREVEYNEVYEGRVVSIMKFGAFMEILPGKEGLLHISEISPERVEKVEDVLSVGDVFKVRVISMEGGKISLSKKKV